MAQLELISRTNAQDATSSPGADASDRLEEMLGRYLGPAIIDAISNPDVTEVYISPQDCAIRLETRSRARQPHINMNLKFVVTSNRPIDHTLQASVSE